MDIPKVKEVMFTKVFSVNTETPFIEAANILLKNNFSGVPVVDAAKRVVGILTDFDVIAKASKIHLPLFMRLMTDHDADEIPEEVKNDVKELLKLRVADVMNNDPLILSEDSTLEQAVSVFEMHHRVNPILVINSDRVLVGVLARSDIIKFYTSSAKAGALSKTTDRDAAQFIREFHSNIRQITRKFKIWFWVGASLFIVIILGVFLLFINLLSSIVQQTR